MAPESAIQRRSNQLLIVFVVLTNVAGNLALSSGMRQTGPILSASPLDYLQALGNPWVVVGILVLAAWMVADLALLSRADLSFVLSVSASGYVLIAIAGYFLLGENISSIRWSGIIVISLGVAIAEKTPLPHYPFIGARPTMHSGIAWLLVGIIATCNTIGDVLNTAGMKRQGEIEEFSPRSVSRMILRIFHNPASFGRHGRYGYRFFLPDFTAHHCRRKLCHSCHLS